MQYQDFIITYNIEHFSYLEYFGIVAAIPRHWKSCLGDPLFPTVNQQRMITFLSAVKSNRCVYSNLVRDKVTTPRAIAKWEQQYPTVDWNWKKIYSLIYTSVRDTKIQYFQFRFFNRIIGVNQFCVELALLTPQHAHFVITRMRPSIIYFGLVLMSICYSGKT